MTWDNVVMKLKLRLCQFVRQPLKVKMILVILMVVKQKFPFLGYDKSCQHTVHGDGICDLHFNTPMCHFDGHDCKVSKPNSNPHTKL